MKRSLVLAITYITYISALFTITFNLLIIELNSRRQTRQVNSKGNNEQNSFEYLCRTKTEQEKRDTDNKTYK